MLKIKKSKASVLIFALIVLFIGIVAAIGAVSSSLISQKSSINTASSTQSFQVADSGAEIILNKIKNASDGDILGSLGLSCDGGIITGSIGNGKDYEITAYDMDGNELTCASDLTQVDKIKSVGSYKNTNRAVEVAVAAGGDGDPMGNFGGFFSASNSGCSYANVVNPYTGEKSCPSGYTTTPAFVINNLSACTGQSDQTFFYICWK
jgi:uncharacterized protein (UPF0333 family)